MRILAWLAVREIAHLRVLWLLAAAALGMVGFASILRDFNFGQDEGRFLADLADGALLSVGTVQAVLLTVMIVQQGWERGLPVLLFAQGVSRAEWIISSLFAIWLSLACLALAIYGGLLWLLAEHGGGVSISSLTGDAGRGLLQVGLVGTFSVFMCAVTRSPFLATALALGATAAAHLSPVIGWAAAHGHGKARLAWDIFGRMLPNFAVIQDGSAASAVIWAAAYATLYVSTACWIFSRREL